MMKVKVRVERRSHYASYHVYHPKLTHFKPQTKTPKKFIMDWSSNKIAEAIQIEKLTSSCSGKTSEELWTLDYDTVAARRKTKDFNGESDTTGRVYFEIPYEDKGIFKKEYNGKWDIGRKLWYIKEDLSSTESIEKACSKWRKLDVN